MLCVSNVAHYWYTLLIYICGVFSLIRKSTFAAFCMIHIQPLYVRVDECDVMMVIELAVPAKRDEGVCP